MSVSEHFSIRWVSASHASKWCKGYYQHSKGLHLPWNRQRGRGLTKLSDKRDYFTFPKVTFPFVSSNIPAAPAYTVYISFIRYARVYTQYSDLLDRAQLLGKKYPIMATLLLCWGRRHRNYTAVITNGMIVTKYQFLKLQWVFSLIWKSCHWRHFYRISLYECHGGCRSVYLWGPCSSLFSFLCCILFLVLNVACVSELFFLDCSFGFL